MTAALHRLGAVWFAPGPAARLAALRVLVGAFSLQYLWPRYEMYTGTAGSSDSLFRPVGVAALLDDPLPVPVFQCILQLTLLANVAFVLGWRFRVTGPLFGGLLLWVMCYRNSWSMIYHSDNLLVFHALVLGVTRAADVFSLDAWTARREGRAPPEEQAWSYGWPVRLICGVTLIAYFLAGVAKVAGPSGLAWVGGEAMRRQLAVDALRKELLGGGAPALVFTLYGQTWLFACIGVLTLVLELGAPLALARAWLGRLWALGVWGMHWGVLVLMEIKFEYALSGVALAAFFPLERVVPRRAASTVVLFDGRCGLCRGSRKWGERLDWNGSVTWVNFRDPAVRALVPSLTDEQLEQEMWVITADGRMCAGFAGWRELMSSLPLTCLPSVLLYVPPVPQIGARVYRAVARRRRLSCEVAPPATEASGPWREILERAQSRAPLPLSSAGGRPA